MTNLLRPISYALWHSDKAAFAAALGDSFIHTGFAIVEDHPVNADVIDRAQSQTEAFFALPEAQKSLYQDVTTGGQRGYSPVGTENAKGRSQADVKEFWHTGRAPQIDAAPDPEALETPHVEQLPDFTRASQDLFSALDAFGVSLLRAIALYLDLDETHFDAAVNRGTSLLRLLHYPPQPTPLRDGSQRAGAHEDINLLTLLLGAQEAGLQVKHRSGQWLDVNAPPGALVVNCGDMLQRLTAGILPSTTHRVINPAPERALFSRYSMPFFLHPNSDFMISALPGCVARGGAAQPPILAGDYLTERLYEIGLLKSA